MPKSWKYPVLRQKAFLVLLTIAYMQCKGPSTWYSIQITVISGDREVFHAPGRCAARWASYDSIKLGTMWFLASVLNLLMDTASVL